MRKPALSTLTAGLLASCYQAGDSLHKSLQKEGIELLPAPPPWLDLKREATQKQREQAAFKYRNFHVRMTPERTKSWLAAMESKGVRHVAVPVDGLTLVRIRNAPEGEASFVPVPAEEVMLVQIEDGKPIPLVHRAGSRSMAVGNIIELGGHRAVCIK
jgi:hypothetical protein